MCDRVKYNDNSQIIDGAINLVYFSSGDFGVPTLKALVEHKDFNIKAIVTSRDKVVYNDKRIVEIAKENDIPCCIPNVEDELYSFLSSIKEDNLCYCVISYKKLSERILSLVDGRAINIHASILPFLRGAAPINWAIRLGFKQTGLTAFKLSNKIDAGDVIETERVDIDNNETYETLFKKLSYRCVDFTCSAMHTFNLIDNDRFIPQLNVGIRRDILTAPKITKNYWNGWQNLSMEEIDRLFRSTPDGLPCKLLVATNTNSIPIISFKAKIWKYEFIPNFEDGSDGVNWYPTECDGKHYIRVAFGNQVEKVMSIKEIQISGKKKLSIEEFLRGFKYTRDGKSNYRLIISSVLID